MSFSFDHGGTILGLARQHGFSLDQCCDFSASINPLGLSAPVRKAIIAALDTLVHYPDTTCGELKQALSSHLGLAPEHFTIANGSTEIIYALPQLLTGKRALIIAPAFSEYSHALLQQGWEVQHHILSPENGFDLDIAALGATLQQRYDALYLCNPGNPTGKLYAPEVIAGIIDLCRDHGTFFVLDEAFMDFCPEASAMHQVIASRQGIVLRSMTKFYAIPGLRLGYAVAAPDLIRQLSEVGGPWSVNTLAQAAGCAALQDCEYTLQSIDYVRRKRQYLIQQLSRFPQLTVFPGSANFLLVRINTTMTAARLKHHLMQKWIMIRDCATFTGLSQHYFRIAVRTATEHERLLTALEEIFLNGEQHHG